MFPIGCSRRDGQADGGNEIWATCPVTDLVQRAVQVQSVRECRRQSQPDWLNPEGLLGLHETGDKSEFAIGAQAFFRVFGLNLLGLDRTEDFECGRGQA